ncbi:Leucine-rich repeat receptor protein kinase [Quillaja saponaria]|uniref:Leucine-rich repeat receptor protein kinase n=1 Tax=Quillaja saponaria TaxID=32244 RepID=A0AAD7PCD9_QUISA|nr:Leucine-rich repeat receptor protein kinase [Quillaja saponaria]
MYQTISCQVSLVIAGKSLESLSHLNLGRNNLSGEIPDSIGYLHKLQSLHLQLNRFSGYIPSSLQNCSQLGFLDAGENKFSGTIPHWMWEMRMLHILRLRSNEFRGSIHQRICQLSNLKVLDLANNSLSGSIPNCLNKIKAMVAGDNEELNALAYGFDYEPYKENLKLVPKGNELEYKENLIFVRMIDLSSNRLSGPIPSEITDLIGVRFLNLSWNNLSGQIAKDIGEMKLLESIDLSMNYISGIIPRSTQLQSLDALGYTGNAKLCGAPLTKNCKRQDDESGENDSTTSELYIGMGVGFAVSFLGVCSVFFCNGT